MSKARPSLTVLLFALLATTLCCASVVEARTEFGPFYLTITDTYFRAEWSIEEDGSEVSYYEITLTNTDASTVVGDLEKNVSSFYPTADDVVFSNLLQSTDYRLDVVAYLTNGNTISAQETFQTTASSSFICDEETIAAFFSSEVYGPVVYPSYTFCGRTWTTYYSTPLDELFDSHREFVVYNADLGIAVVAFRGTIRTLEDWGVNFELDQEPCEDFIHGGDCDGLVHDGFGDEYKRSRSDIRSYVTDIVNAGFRRIIVTGHSQGAALATIAAIDLLSYVNDNSNNDFQIIPITLGSPRVGDEDFADDWDERFGVENQGQTTYTALRFVGESPDGEDFDPITEIPVSIPILTEYVHVRKSIDVVFFDQSTCDLTTDLFIPCHSIYAYLESIAAGSEDHLAPWTFSVVTPNLNQLRSAVTAPLVVSSRATIDPNATPNDSPSPNSPSPNSPSPNNSPNNSPNGSPVTLSNPFNNSPSSNNRSPNNSPSSDAASFLSSVLVPLSLAFVALFAL